MKESSHAFCAHSLQLTFYSYCVADLAKYALIESLVNVFRKIRYILRSTRLQRIALGDKKPGHNHRFCQTTETFIRSKPIFKADKQRRQHMRNLE